MMTPGTDTGAGMFARYAYAPNSLGYCGPSDSAPVLAHSGAPDAGPGTEDVRELARCFHGAWPYLVILARLADVDDPLDRRVVESYWLGGGLGDGLDARRFGEELLAAIGPQAGHYWKHLTLELLDESAANHCFHVFGVYPWSRLLQPTGFEAPLSVLDNCRIRWATVLRVKADRMQVRSRRLTWNGSELGLSEPRVSEIATGADNLRFVPGVTAGDRIALHWDRPVDQLTEDQVDVLRRTTTAQIEATNRRLTRRAGDTRDSSGCPVAREA